MSIYDKASLVLIPSGTKTSKVYSQKPTNGDGDFTFSRSTAATRVNASGNIEKETQNLLLQSNNFNTTWTLYSVTATSGQAGYDGSSDAWEISTTGVNGFENLNQNISFSGVHTISMYAKAGSNNYLTMRSLGTDIRVQFKLDDGTHSTTFGSPIDTFMEDAGGGWYRCGFTANFSSASEWVFYPQQIGITDAGTIYIQDAQLEQGLVARDYIETTTTAIYGGITDNVPRLDYTDSSCPALLLEPQRTNVLQNSEYFSGSDWINNGVTITNNAVISPEGKTNAALLTGVSGGFGIVKFSTWTATNKVASCFAKAGSGNIFKIANVSAANRYVLFDLSDGTISEESAGWTGSIEDFGNGWYRCTAISNNETGTFSLGTTAASDSVYIYGAQLEAGSYATSYIPAYGSSVTRNADSCSKTGVSSLIGQTEGTMFAEINFVDNNTDSMFMTIGDGTSINRIHIGYDKTSDWIYCNVKAAGFQQALITSSSPSDGIKKIAVAYKQNDYVVYINGVSVGADTNANVPTLTRIDIGGYFSAGFEYPVKQNLLFKTRLTNAELAALTTI